MTHQKKQDFRGSKKIIGSKEIRGPGRGKQLWKIRFLAQWNYSVLFNNEEYMILCIPQNL